MLRVNRLRVGAIATISALAAAGACLPQRPEGDLTRIQDRDDAGLGGNGGLIFPDASATGGAQDTDPHGVSAVQPGHGPFVGGTHVLVQGSGFSYQPRVWFGDVEVPATDVVAVSTKKIQVTTPPASPGTVDVRVQAGDDASTARVLSAAFTYDAFYADPNEGPTSGGTEITLHGSATTWNSPPITAVAIGDQPCADLTVVDDVTITCTTAASTPGSRPITVVAADGTKTSVADAFTYADSDNGFRGGLSGSTLAGKLRVLAFDSYTGDPLKGAVVIAGDDPKTAITATIGDGGIAELTGPTLNAPVTVTVARKCSQPTTFVAVPVDTVTMYLDPVISPACADPMGDPPPVGGKASSPPVVQGEIIFPVTGEFKRGPWTMVPQPVGNERRVAYVFAASSDPKTVFQLPDVSQAVTESSAGTNGYSYQISAPVGNVSLYALVGIEDRTVSPPVFAAYAFGTTAGVATAPGQTASDVYVKIDTPLDQAVTISVDPPTPGPKGPDRLVSSVAVTLGTGAYAIFPGAQKTTFLPLQGDLSFVGLPPVDGSLLGQSYVASAQAGTGPQLGTPKSVIGMYATKDASQKLVLDEFVTVPILKTPAGGATWDGVSYDVAFSQGGLPPDVLVLDVASGGGLVDWTIAAPGATTSFRVPDLRKIASAGLVPGPIAVTVDAAHIPGFDYAGLRYRNLGPQGWTSYSRDVFYAQLPP